MLKLAYPIHPAPPEKRPPGGQIFPDGAVIPLDAPQCWVARTQPDGSVSRAFEESVWDVEASDADLRADVRLALEDLARLASDQLARLERACSQGRRWKLADFQTFIADHPLLRHLAVRLIWGAYGPDGKLLLSFRVAEDSSWADAQDQLLQPPADCQVGVLHPAEVSAATLDKWRQVLLDYAVLQPFAQIERRIYSADAHLEALPGLAQTVSHGRLFTLSRRGWRKHFRDFGWVNELHKPLSDNILAVIALEPGIAIADTRSSEPQQVTGLKLQSGTFASLGPVIGSELLKDYYELTEAL